MYRHALLLTLGLTAVVGAAGCTSTFTKGTPIMEYQKGRTPPLQEAPSDGEYVLMASMMNTTPKATLRLREGDALGFKPGQTGQIVAVAGTKEFVLPDGNYIWKRRSMTAPSESSTPSSSAPPPSSAAPSQPPPAAPTTPPSAPEPGSGTSVPPPPPPPAPAPESTGGSTAPPPPNVPPPPPPLP